MSELTVQLPEIKCKTLSKAAIPAVGEIQESAFEALRSFVEMPANRWMILSTFEGAFNRYWISELLSDIDLQEQEVCDLCCINDRLVPGKLHFLSIEQGKGKEFLNRFFRLIQKYKNARTIDFSSLMDCQGHDASLQNYLDMLAQTDHNALPLQEDAQLLRFDYSEPYPIVFGEGLNWDMLFGHIGHQPNGCANARALSAGLIQNANHGLLVLPLEELNEKPDLWFHLKQLLNRQHVQWCTNPAQMASPYIHSNAISADIHVILMGSTDAISDFQAMDADAFTKRALYAELNPRLNIETSFDDYIGWLEIVRTRHQIEADLDRSAIHELLGFIIRTIESHYELPLEEALIASIMEIAAQQALVDKKTIASRAHIIQAISVHMAPAQKTIADLDQMIIDGTLHVQVHDKVVGQVNALTVLHIDGHPYPVGETIRLSATVHLGEAELIDIDRKAELGGHIHAKAMMIIHSYITNNFSVEHQCPLSASLVFEQSYHEIDGDSASLAGLCAVLSALSEVGIEQNLAVTGAIDQFGNVLPVGGVNEKIEAFYRACYILGMTGDQGVIIPQANAQQLQLSVEIQDAIRNEEFNIYTVQHVEDAIELLTDIPAHESENEEDETTSSEGSIFARIQERLENTGEQTSSKNWFCQLFSREK